jgi:hypothetical protein
MQRHAVLAATLLCLTLAVGVQAGSPPGDSHGKPSAPKSLFTPAILEPDGYTAACFATNVDTVARTISAEIVDWRGDNVTHTSSCGVPQGPGITCQSTSVFANASALRCVISTDGDVKRVRASLATSASPYPFTSPANVIVPAQ